MTKPRAPYMAYDDSDLADRGQRSLSLDWVPLVQHYTSTTTVDLMQSNETTSAENIPEKAPASPLRSISAPSKPLVLLAISDQVSDVLLGIAVIRWYSEIREDSQMFPSTPFTDAIAAFCLTLALCARAIIVLSVSVLGCLQMLTKNRPNLGRADWRLHATELGGAGTIAALSALLASGRYAPCLFLLATLLTLCTCTTAAVFSLLTVVWSCREKALLINRMRKDDMRKQAFVLRGITAVTSTSVDPRNLDAQSQCHGHGIDVDRTSIRRPGCSETSSYHLNEGFLSSPTTTIPTTGHENTLKEYQHDSVCSDDAFSTSRRIEAAEAEYDRIMARTTNEVFGLHSREQSASTVIKSQHFHSSSVSSIHRRKPSESQQHIVANVYGDTYVDDGGELGEWRRASASLDSVQLTPPGSPTSGLHAERPASLRWNASGAGENSLDGSQPAQMGQLSDEGQCDDHFEYSGQGKQSLNSTQPSASEYNQPLRSPIKVRPLSTSSIFSAFTAPSHQTDRRDSESSFRPLDEQDFFGTIPALSASQSVASLRSMARGLSKQSSSSRLREQASTQPHPLSRCLGEGRSSPGTPTRESAPGRQDGISQGPHLTAEILEEERKSKEESIRVTIRACGFLIIMWCAMALSMPYILHPVKDGGNEEVNYVYPLLLVTGIVLSGPLNLIQILLTNDRVFMASDASTVAGMCITASSTPAHDRGRDHDHDHGATPHSVPGGYPDSYYGEGHFESTHLGTSRYGSPGMIRSRPGVHPESRSCSALSYSEVSVASVAYSTKHWRAGKIKGDRVLRPRRLLRRAANMLDPKPKLDVLPAQQSHKIRTKETWRARQRLHLPKRNLTAPLRWVKRAKDGSQEPLSHLYESVVGGDSTNHAVLPSPSSCLSSPGLGRNGSRHEGGVTQMQLSDHSLSLERDRLVLDEDVPSCIIDLTHGDLGDVRRPADQLSDTNMDFVLDGLSAMLLPHIAPGVKIGPDVRVAANSEKDLIEEYEDYQRRVAQSGEWWSFSEDRANTTRTKNSRRDCVRHQSSSLADSDSSTWGFSCADRIQQPHDLPIPPARSARYVPFSYHRASHISQVSRACALNLPTPLRQVKIGVKTAGHATVTSKIGGHTPVKGSRLVAGFPSQHLSSAYAMLERTPPKRTPRFERVVSDQQRLGSTGVKYLVRSYRARSAIEKKQRSSTSRAILHSTGALEPRMITSSRHAGRAVDDEADFGQVDETSMPQDSVHCDRDHHRCFDDTFSASLDADCSRPSLCLDSEQGSANHITPPMQSTPKDQSASDKERRGSSDRHAKSPTWCSSRSKALGTASDNAAPCLSHGKRAWKVMPEAISLPPGVPTNAASAAGSAPCSVTQETAMSSDSVVSGPAPSDLDAGADAGARDLMSTAFQHAPDDRIALSSEAKDPGEIVIGEALFPLRNLASEDSEAGMVKSLSADVLEAFARRAVGAAARDSSQPLQIDTARNGGGGRDLSERGFLSPTSACLSASGSETRKSLGSSLGLGQDRISSRWPSPAPGDFSAPELLSVSQRSSARNSVSPSAASSGSRRRSLGSELGLSRLASCQLEVADDTQPDVTAEMNTEHVATSAADKRSTGGTITTTDSSLLSSEILLSPVGSDSVRSPQSISCRSPRHSPSRAPESPIRQLARKHARSNSDDVEAQSRPAHLFDLRQLSTLDYHMHLNPHLNERLPTLEEASEEASHSTCGAPGQRQNDSEWGILSRQLDRIYFHARSPEGEANYSIAESIEAEGLPDSILPSTKGSNRKAMSRSSSARYGSPFASPQAQGWLHIVDRQTQVVATEAHGLGRPNKDRNGSGCSRVSMMAATPQKTIGMRSEFWTTHNHPLPPLPFDIIGNLAHVSQLSSTLEYVYGVENLNEESELPWEAPEWRHPHRTSDMRSQLSEVEIIDELNEWQRISAEHVRNTPQRTALNLSAHVSRTVRKLEKRKSSSTLLKGRQSMSSLLGLGKSHSSSDVGAATYACEGQRPARGEITQDTRTTAVSSTSTPSAPWTVFNRGRNGSGAASMRTDTVSTYGEEVASEQVLLEAELEQLLRHDAQCRPSSAFEVDRRLVEDTMKDFHLGGGPAEILRSLASLPKRKAKRIPVPRATEDQWPLRERRSVLSPLGQNHVNADEDSDKTLVPFSSSIKSLPSKNHSIPQDLTLQAVSDSSRSTTAVSRTVSARSQKDYSKGVDTTSLHSSNNTEEQSLPLFQQQSHHWPTPAETAGKTEWPASTPARARHLSQMPEVEGAFRLLMAMSPSPVKQNTVPVAEGMITGKRRWPRLSEAHLSQSTLPILENQDTEACKGRSIHACTQHDGVGLHSPRRLPAQKGPDNVGRPPGMRM